MLRPLTVEDATPQYVKWLDEQSNQGFIVSAKQKNSVKQVREYIAEREDNDGVTFLGIFTRAKGFHIGNIKYEPINMDLKYAVMGILIGDSEWRGKGVAAEVINKSADWLHSEKGINEIILGLDKRNLAAIRAYEKTGFKMQQTDKIAINDEFSASMVLYIDKLDLENKGSSND